VYVQTFPEGGGKRLVSEGGGRNAIWSRDGRRLFYRESDQVLEVEVGRAPAFTTGKPVPLFSGRYRMTGRDFDVSIDGAEFVMMRANGDRTTARIHVLLDWWRSLDARTRGALTMTSSLRQLARQITADGPRPHRARARQLSTRVRDGQRLPAGLSSRKRSPEGEA
jgi:hypothetical protein